MIYLPGIAVVVVVIAPMYDSHRGPVYNAGH